MNKTFWTSLVCFGLLANTSVNAKPASTTKTENYGALAKTSYIAFECSTLSIFLKDKKEGKRLFDYGYQTGTKYLEAWKSGKLNKDNNKEAPIAWTLVGGPSHDFILGQLSEIATMNISKSLYKNSNKRAQDLFDKAKCKDLGR